MKIGWKQKLMEYKDAADMPKNSSKEVRRNGRNISSNEKAIGEISNDKVSEIKVGFN